MYPRSVAVLGGGISGLSAVFHLTRRFPPRSGTHITLVEGSQALGGWVKSEKVHVRDGVGHEAEVVLEGGPRTLRPVAKAVLELVSNSQRDSVWTGVVLEDHRAYMSFVYRYIYLA